MNVDKYQEQSNNHQHLVESALKLFKKNEKPIRYPIALEVLIDFSKNISFIYDAMIINASKNNLYATFILYRSLIEHFFRAFYISDRTISTKSDEVAENFQKHYFISEFIAEKMGVMDMEDLQSGKNEKTDFLKFLIEKHPELEGFDKENQREISAAIAQFSLKFIIKYLHNKNIESPKLKDITYVFTQMLPEYSRFSTYTHGGAYAAELIRNLEEDNQTEIELARILEISLTSVFVIREMAIFNYEPDEELRTITYEIMQSRK